MTDLGKALEPMVREIVSAEISGLGIEEKMKELLGKVANKASNVLEIRLNGEEKGEKVSMYHNQFPELLEVIAIEGLNTLITGGAGLGKSHSVQAAAKSLKLDFGSISFSNQSTKTDLMGFVDAMGVLRKAGFVDRFTNGGIFLADEVDAGGANILVILNSAISNGFLQLPDGTEVMRHKDFRFVGTANTNLRGAKGGFVRNALDSAFTDRFVFIEWKNDEELEQKLTNNDAWLNVVRKCRQQAHDTLDGIVITPRASYNGASLLRNSTLSPERIFEMTILKGIDEDSEKTLRDTLTSKDFNDCDKIRKKPKVKKIEINKPTPEPEAELEMEDVIIDPRADEDYDEPKEYAPVPEELVEYEEFQEVDGKWN